MQSAQAIDCFWCGELLFLAEPDRLVCSSCGYSFDARMYMAVNEPHGERDTRTLHQCAVMSGRHSTLLALDGMGRDGRMRHVNLITLDAAPRRAAVPKASDVAPAPESVA